MDSKVLLYIVHSPPSESVDWQSKEQPDFTEKRKIHMAKLRQAFLFATKHQLPIAVELADKLQEQRLECFLAALPAAQPRVRLIRNMETLVHDLGIYNSGYLRTSIAMPSLSRILVAGHFRERCCSSSLLVLHATFPGADLVLLKGDSTVSSKVKRDIEFEREKKRIQGDSILHRSAYSAPIQATA